MAAVQSVLSSDPRFCHTATPEWSRPESRPDLGWCNGCGLGLAPPWIPETCCGMESQHSERDRGIGKEREEKEEEEVEEEEKEEEEEEEE